MNELKAGDLLGGKYRLEKELGEGGMGAVWIATQEPLGRKVALKVLHPALAQDANVVLRFRREAELAASLGHNHIVQVTDFGHDEGRAFLVMELLSGQSLAELIEDSAPLPPERIAFITKQVLSALGAAHAKGIVHRDLKPDNIFLTDFAGVSDVVKLLDFGIARLAEASGEGKLTTTGQVLGTPAYMSPEQARGAKVDARTDLYALGVVMYEAASGRMPFAGDSYNALMFAIVGEEPKPLSELRPDLPAPFVQLVEKAMAKDPEARFADAAAMTAAIEALPSAARMPATGEMAVAATMVPTDAIPATAISQPPAPTGASAQPSQPQAPPAQALPSTANAPPPAAPSHRSPWPLVVGALAIGALAALGAVFLVGGGDAEEPELAELENAPIESLEAEPIADAGPPVPVDPAPVEAPGAVASPDDEEAVAAEAATSTMESSMASRMHQRRAPRMVDVTCTGGSEREHYMIRRNDAISASFASSANAMPVRELRELVNQHSEAITACYVGHAFNNGQMFKVDLDENGAITRAWAHEYCPVDDAVKRCVLAIVRALPLRNDQDEPKTMGFGLHLRGT